MRGPKPDRAWHDTLQNDRTVRISSAVRVGPYMHHNIIKIAIKQASKRTRITTRKLFENGDLRESPANSSAPPEGLPGPRCCSPELPGIDCGVLKNGGFQGGGMPKAPGGA